MKYRATCPGCGVRFSRSSYFTNLPHLRRRCKACGCRYRVDSLWEWVGSSIMGVGWATFFLLGWFGLMSWPLAIVLIVFVQVLCYLLYPYVTPFVLIQET